MFKLFYAPRTCALASLIALEESGAPYEAVPVDFARSEQRQAAYLAINPKGRVPALLLTAQGVPRCPRQARTEHACCSDPPCSAR